MENGELCLSIELSNIVVDGGDENDIRTLYTYYASGEDICVIPGSIPLGAKSIPVQIIIACPQRAQGGMRLKSTLDIFKFYGSHVQCFISGWFAGQLFPEYTDRTEAIEWNTDQGPPSQKAKEKYRQRGYSFVTPPESHTTTIKYRSGMRVVPFWGVFSPVNKSQIQGYIEFLEKWMRFVSWVSDAEGRLHMIVDTKLERARTDGDEDVINFTRAVYKSLPSALLPAAMPLSADTIEGSTLVQDLQRSGRVPNTKYCRVAAYGKGPLQLFL
uniref:Anthranilate phosphoribosyltransferase n=1 Tax=Talaromyces marneffei PM1 TaxID=1077442 RepID=A0A093VIR6_TALMA